MAEGLDGCSVIKRWSFDDPGGVGVGGGGGGGENSYIRRG